MDIGQRVWHAETQRVGRIVEIHSTPIRDRSPDPFHDHMNYRVLWEVPRDPDWGDPPTERATWFNGTSGLTEMAESPYPAVAGVDLAAGEDMAVAQVLEQEELRRRALFELRRHVNPLLTPDLYDTARESIRELSSRRRPLRLFADPPTRVGIEQEVRIDESVLARLRDTFTSVRTGRQSSRDDVYSFLPIAPPPLSREQLEAVMGQTESVRSEPSFDSIPTTTYRIAGLPGMSSYGQEVSIKAGATLDDLKRGNMVRVTMTDEQGRTFLLHMKIVAPREELPSENPKVFGGKRRVTGVD